MTHPANPQPEGRELDALLFAPNETSVKGRIETALFILTTLVWDEQSRGATISVLEEALALLARAPANRRPSDGSC